MNMPTTATTFTPVSEVVAAPPGSGAQGVAVTRDARRGIKVSPGAVAAVAAGPRAPRTAGEPSPGATCARAPPDALEDPGACAAAAAVIGVWVVATVRGLMLGDGTCTGATAGLGAGAGAGLAAAGAGLGAGAGAGRGPTREQVQGSPMGGRRRRRQSLV